ncbi:MAG: hypothetical protein N2235_25325, partial [Fischerella sp.]|nr:hypothetical protein [Fischerella sp.]
MKLTVRCGLEVAMGGILKCSNRVLETAFSIDLLKNVYHCNFTSWNQAYLMIDTIYTVISFAPVQGFIEKSRKLRDLYGSSYLLSYLSWAICSAAESNHCKVISPAMPNVTQGMSNQIIIQGDFTKKDASAALNNAWKCVTQSCREWIEEELPGEYYWKRNWDLWTKHAWEFFWVQADDASKSISDVRQKLNEQKYWRAWTGINWQGESSTLSGADAIAYPGLGRIADPCKYNYQEEKTAVEKFYQQLSQKLGESFIDITPGLNFSGEEKIERSKDYGESFIDPTELLSIPEIIKRLITHKAIAEKLTEHFERCFGNNGSSEQVKAQIQQLSEDLNPQRFRDLSRLKKKKWIGENLQLEQEKFSQGWFAGDGDKAGDYLKKFAKQLDEAEKIHDFSTTMRKWGEYFKNNPPDLCRVIYAGGDDFLGVFYDTEKEGKNLQPRHCINYFSHFKTKVWDTNEVDPEKKKPITVSVGFVWAAPDVPQRDVLQHCREAEKSAKSQGRDRIAFRVLFNNGNYLEWVCPWWLLEQDLLSSYRDREGKQNWTHIYN